MTVEDNIKNGVYSDWSRDELWVPICGYKKEYIISNTGRIQSIRTRTNSIKGKDLKYAYSNGYPHVSLYKNGVSKNVRVHQAVLNSFIGPAPKGMEAAHLDGDRKNCNLNNLKYVTRKENHSHKKIHGTHQAGEKNPACKYTASKIKKIIPLLNKGFSQREISRKLKIHYITVNAVIKGRQWKNIK